MNLVIDKLFELVRRAPTISAIEENGLNAANQIEEHFYRPPATIAGTLDGLTGQFVQLYYCPSDIGSDQTVGNYQRRRGNYVVNWGNSKYGQADEPVGKAPFSHINGNTFSRLQFICCLF